MEVLDSIMERYPTGAARIQRLLFYAEHIGEAVSSDDETSKQEVESSVKKAYEALSATCKSEGNVVQYKTIFGNFMDTNNSSGSGNDNGSSMVVTTTNDDAPAAGAASGEKQQQPAAPAARSTGVDYNGAWADEQEAMARQSREVLEHRLQVAQSQLHKESIRTAFLALAQHAAGTGDFVAAFQGFLRAKDYCTNRPQTTAVCLHIVSVSLAMNNLISANDFIHKLEHTLRSVTVPSASSGGGGGGGNNAGTAGTELDSILVQTAAALERMASGKFSEALQSLIQVVQHDEMDSAFENAGAGKHQLLYWVAPRDVSLYAAFLCLCHGSSAEMLALADHVSAMEGVPQLKQALTDFVHANYQDCWNCVAVTLLPSLKVDPLLGPHLDSLLKGIRRKILQQYWKAYSRVPLPVMAKDLGSSLVPSLDSLRNDWVTLILEAQQTSSDLANTRLDMASDTLHRDPPADPSVVQAAKLQQLTKTVLNDSYSMVVRLACQESDIMVTSGNDAHNPDGSWRTRGQGRRGGGGDHMIDDMEDDDDDDMGAVGHLPQEDVSMIDAMNPEDLY